jgi:uncharacterized protein YigA (DUF484 family)
MTTTLVERLLGLKQFGPEHFSMLYEAANRIEEQDRKLYELAVKNEALERQLAEAQANDRTAMGYLAEVRAIVGGDDFPDMVRRVAELDAQKDGWQINAEQWALENAEQYKPQITLLREAMSIVVAKPRSHEAVRVAIQALAATEQTAVATAVANGSKTV